jgi:DNA-binding transcriptional regulator YdaS (Cro superfamily)
MTLAAYMTLTGKTDAEIADALGVNSEVVRLWRHGHRRISAERAVDLSKVTGIPLYQLRPDLWNPPPQGKRRTKRPALASATQVDGSHPSHGETG